MLRVYVITDSRGRFRKRAGVPWVFTNKRFAKKRARQLGGFLHVVPLTGEKPKSPTMLDLARKTRKASSAVRRIVSILSKPSFLDGLTGVAWKEADC